MTLPPAEVARLDSYARHMRTLLCAVRRLWHHLTGGHLLYLDPAPGECCTCPCGETLAWIDQQWKRLPKSITYRIT